MRSKPYTRAVLSGIWILISCLSMPGCKKLVEVDAPRTTVAENNVFASDATANAALIGIFDSYVTTSGSTLSPISTSFYTGLSADELALFSSSASALYVAFYQNHLSAAIGTGGDMWLNQWPLIYDCNQALEKLPAAGNVSENVKKQLLGESRFIRALVFLQLADLYGDIPIVTSTDYTATNNLERQPVKEVLQQIITDLKEAQTLLSDVYVDGSAVHPSDERTRPTRWAATALLARAYLYNKDYADAAAQASDVIAHTGLYKLVDLDKVFLKNSDEAIWQLQVISRPPGTWEAKTYILPSTGPNVNDYPVVLNHRTMDAFEADDNRRQVWVGSVTANGKTYYYPFKYQYNAPDEAKEYEMVLRLAELYLIRAECKVYNGDAAGAAGDLNVIRQRAGLADYAGPTDNASLLDAILHERQAELFTEGHRWFDLKRTGKVDAVMSVVTPEKGGTWKTEWQLYPIPYWDLTKGPHLTQNPGY